MGRFNELCAVFDKVIKTKKMFQEAARGFEQLGETVDADDEFACRLAAMAKMGAMRCYERLDDKPAIWRSGIRAARLFVKSARVNRQLSPDLRDTWEGALADGLLCWRTAVDVLRGEPEGKMNMAHNQMMAIGATELEFGLHSWAGVTFDAALKLALAARLSPAPVFSAAFAAVDAYTRTGRPDLAFSAMDRVDERLLEGWFVEQVQPNQFMRRWALSLKFHRAVLLLMLGRMRDCAKFVGENLEDAFVRLFNDLVLATRANSVEGIDEIICELKAQGFLERREIKMLKRHRNHLANDVERAFAVFAENWDGEGGAGGECGADTCGSPSG